MSVQNSPMQKRLRSQYNAKRKGEAARRITHCGVIVSKKDVKRHRYLAEQGLPYSESLAEVFINDRSTRRKEEELALEMGHAIESPRERTGLLSSLIGAIIGGIR